MTVLLVISNFDDMRTSTFGILLLYFLYFMHFFIYILLLLFSNSVLIDINSDVETQNSRKHDQQLNPISEWSYTILGFVLTINGSLRKHVRIQ